MRLNIIKEHISQDHIEFLNVMTRPLKSAEIYETLGFTKSKGDGVRIGLMEMGYVECSGYTNSMLYTRTRRDIPREPYTTFIEKNIEPVDLDYPYWPVPHSTLEAVSLRYPSFRDQAQAQESSPLTYTHFPDFDEQLASLSIINKG